jgi:DNA-binding FrmR family transcriptional regulator
VKTKRKFPTPAPRHDDNLARLARIEGQVRGVRRMVEEGAYCIDILTQIQAVRSALQSVSERILRRHMERCVVAAVRNGEPVEIEKKLDEVMSVFTRACGRP